MSIAIKKRNKLMYAKIVVIKNVDSKKLKIIERHSEIIAKILNHFVTKIFFITYFIKFIGEVLDNMG